jgi:hypothetical protein
LIDFEDVANYNPALTDELSFGDALDPYPRLREIAARGAVQEAERTTRTITTRATLD